MARPNNKKYERPKNFGGAMLRLVRYCRAFLPMLLISTILVTFSTICRLIGPNKLGELADLINPTTNAVLNIAAVKDIAKLLIVLYALAFFSTYFANVIIGKTTFTVSKKLRRDINLKINKLPLSYIDATPYGDVLSRITNDVDSIGQTLMNSASSLVSAVVMFLGSLIMMVLTNPLMALAAVVSTFFGFSLMTLIVKKSQKYFVQQQKSLGELNGIIEETFAGQSVIKVFNAEGEACEKFNKVNKNLQASSWKSQFTSSIMHPLMGFIGNLGYVVVCIVGAVLVMKGSVGFGVVVSFMIYVRLFTHPLSQIAQIVTQLQTTAAASERVFEFLDQKEMDNDECEVVSPRIIKGEVEFKNVNFSYSKEKTVIRDFSAVVKAGSKVALVGPTGAGKTTIVNLLMRFYDINSGSILIDGVDIKDYTREQVHEMFSMVLQDSWLFEGTIRENLVYNNSSVTVEEIEKVAEASGISHFIKTLPQGLDTMLDDNTTISAGQKQLLTIARAMLKNSPMLILDEATSNVDTRTEELIQQAMDRLMKGRTSFVIAHRLSTIKNAGLILVLNNGDIIEQGTHEELLEKKGFYASLYNSQFD